MPAIPRSIYLFLVRDSLGRGLKGQRQDGRRRTILLETHKPNFHTELLIWFQTVAQDDSLMKFWHQQESQANTALIQGKKIYLIVVVSRGLTTHKIRLLKILCHFWAYASHLSLITSSSFLLKKKIKTINQHYSPTKQSNQIKTVWSASEGMIAPSSSYNSWKWEDMAGRSIPSNIFIWKQKEAVFLGWVFCGFVLFLKSMKNEKEYIAEGS